MIGFARTLRALHQIPNEVLPIPNEAAATAVPLGFFENPGRQVRAPRSHENPVGRVNASAAETGKVQEPSNLARKLLHDSFLQFQLRDSCVVRSDRNTLGLPSDITSSKISRSLWRRTRKVRCCSGAKNAPARMKRAVRTNARRMGERAQSAVNEL